MKKLLKELEIEDKFYVNVVRYLKIGPRHAARLQDGKCVEFKENDEIFEEDSIEDIMHDFRIAVDCIDNEVSCDRCPAMVRYKEGRLKNRAIYSHLSEVLKKLGVLSRECA